MKRRLSEEESKCLNRDARSGVEEPQRLVDDIKAASEGECSPDQRIEDSITPLSNIEVLSDIKGESENQKTGDHITCSEDSGQQEVKILGSKEKGFEVKSKTGSVINTAQRSPASTTDDVDVAEIRVEIKQEDFLDGKEGTKEEDRTRLRDELRCIIKFMDEDMKDIFSVQKGLDDGTRKTIAFDYLWQLYKPGDVVISRKGEQKRAYVVLHVTGGRALNNNGQPSTNKEREKIDERWRYLTREQQQEKEAYLAKHSKTTPFVVDWFYIDFDGTKFGPLPQKFTLSEYEGELTIDSLEIYPTRFDSDATQTQKTLIKRGKRFVKLAQGGHKYYSGGTIREPLILEKESEVCDMAFFRTFVIRMNELS